MAVIRLSNLKNNELNFRMWLKYGLKGQKLLIATRPERAEAPSPGHRPGYMWTQACRPVGAKAFKYLAIHKAFALTGRLVDCHYTQGDALG